MSEYEQKFTFFWDGPFSQWYPAPMEVDGMKFVNCEQYMMYKKAMLFGDVETADKIMATDLPYEQKALGREVKPFDAQKWKAVAKSIVYRGNVAKFTQHPNLREKLIETKGTVIVEASPYDKIWGIGLKANDPRASDPNKWKGSNWLGEVLMKVRHDVS